MLSDAARYRIVALSCSFIAVPVGDCSVTPTNHPGRRSGRRFSPGPARYATRRSRPRGYDDRPIFAVLTDSPGSAEAKRHRNLADYCWTRLRATDRMPTATTPVGLRQRLPLTDLSRKRTHCNHYWLRYGPGRASRDEGSHGPSRWSSVPRRGPAFGSELEGRRQAGGVEVRPHDLFGHSGREGCIWRRSARRSRARRHALSSGTTRSTSPILCASSAATRRGEHHLEGDGGLTMRGRR